MTKILKAFVRNQDGLVTVEWVALASALVVGAIAIGWLVLGNMKAPANTIGTQISATATTETSVPHP
jgi:Flp pilus assembly pilin Flp